MKKSSKGFTLIELVIVVAILAITLTITSDILISLVRSNNKTRIQNELEQQSNFVSLKLEKELRNAQSVDSSENTELSLTLENSEEITYSLNEGNGVLLRDKDGTTDPVTSAHEPGGVSVSCGSSGCFNVEGTTPQRVNVSLVFEPSTSGTLGTSFTGKVEVNTTVVLRNTY